VTLSFDEWMKAVDAACISLYGLSVYDLPDCCFADWYEDECTPLTAARRACRAMEYDE